MVKRPRRSLMVAVSFGAIACSGATTPSSSLYGIYDLVSINGAALPVSCGNSCAIPSGTLVLFNGDTITKVHSPCQALCAQMRIYDSSYACQPCVSTIVVSDFWIDQTDSTLFMHS